MAEDQIDSVSNTNRGYQVGSEDSPPAYSTATADEMDSVATMPRESLSATDGILLAPGFNPFLGIKPAEQKGMFDNFGLVDTPMSLVIAKKSLVSTISALYTTLLIVTCVYSDTRCSQKCLKP